MVFNEKYISCKLCGKKHPYFGGKIRMVRLGSQEREVTTRYSVLKGWGYYEPRLTAEECVSLGKGEHNICTDRAGCNKRRLAQL